MNRYAIKSHNSDHSGKAGYMPAGMGGATRSTAGKRTDCQQIAYEDYEFLLTEYEKLPRRTPQFRLFVQRYLKRVTVYPKSVRFL